METDKEKSEKRPNSMLAYYITFIEKSVGSSKFVKRNECGYYKIPWHLRTFKSDNSPTSFDGAGFIIKMYNFSKRNFLISFFHKNPYKIGPVCSNLRETKMKKKNTRKYFFADWRQISLQNMSYVCCVFASENFEFTNTYFECVFKLVK